jgi:hypothetical protein
MPRNRTTGVEFKSQLDFPVVLACPVFPAKRDLYDTNTNAHIRANVMVVSAQR